ncbi:hypothetical protein Pan153_15300 [Gimesia panareensis]|uniref:Uncharacterized protein n=1 Tax=Gimesia panareensis TaxID=2527978 RepID=A0A518FKM5_9PLAN|nr:hypothetical protein Pan153_15300 [Gimesia panareensis]
MSKKKPPRHQRIGCTDDEEVLKQSLTTGSELGSGFFQVEVNGVFAGFDVGFQFGVCVVFGRQFFFR